MRKYDDLAKLSDDALVHLYTSDLIEYSKHHAGTGQPGANLDYVAANAASHRCSAVYGELRRRGRNSQMKLLGLLDHPDADVRSSTAAVAMEFAPERAEPVLQAIVEAGGLRGLMAKYGLEARQRGHAQPIVDVPYRSRPTLAEVDRWPLVPKDIASVLAAVSNRLDADTPELADALRRATIEKRRQAAVTATEMAVAEVGLSDDVVEEAQYALRFEALPALEEHESMKALVARLENEAAQREAGDVNDRGVAIRLRAEARAASSLAIALTGDSTRLDEVIHEAIAAQDEPEGLIAFLTEMLRK